LPNDPMTALVVASDGLGQMYHDALMSLIERPEAQTANELADILAVTTFPDGNFMLNWLHTRNHLKKTPTTNVLMTPAPQSSLPLNELNELIAQQKGVALEDLAVSDGSQKKPKPQQPKDDPTRTTSASVNAGDEDSTVVDTQPITAAAPVVESAPEPQTPSEMRSVADKLYKQARALRQKADELDPPKRKSKKATVEV
jgi:hypothetical protein